MQPLANLIGAASLAVGGVLLWGLGQSWRSPVVGWAGLLLYPTFPLLMNTIGSETPIYLTFCLGAFWLYAEIKYSWTALLSGLAVLTRPDGLLVPLILAGDYLLRVRRPIPWKPVAIFLVITLPWFIFAWSYFGAPLPATLFAKQHQGQMAISDSFLTGLLQYARLYTSLWLYRIEAVLAVVGLGFLIWGSIRRSTPGDLRYWWLPIIWGMLYTLSYWLLGVTRYFWYYAPLVPCLVILVGLGIQAVFALVSQAFRKSGDPGQRPPATLPVTGAFIFVALLGISQAWRVWDNPPPPDARFPIYRDVGLWLREHTSSQDRVGALELGVIGYFTDNPMVDFAGLLYPEVAARLTSQATYEDAALWAVNNYSLDYVVVPDGFFPRLEEQYLASACQPAHVISGLPGENSAYQQVIYHCQP